MNTVGKCTAHCRTGVEGTQNNNGLDGGAGQLRGDIVRDPRQANHLDLQHLSRSQRLFEVWR